MMMTVKCRSFFGTPEPATITVELEKTDHWSSREGMTAYLVIKDLKMVGKIERVTESTDRHYNRIRVPGKGRLAWGWERIARPGRMPESNSPGVYSHNMADAVAQVLGYDRGEKV